MAAAIDSVTSAVPDPIVPIIRVGLDPQPLAESEPQEPGQKEQRRQAGQSVQHAWLHKASLNMGPVSHDFARGSVKELLVYF